MPRFSAPSRLALFAIAVLSGACAAPAGAGAKVSPAAGEVLVVEVPRAPSAAVPVEPTAEPEPLRRAGSYELGFTFVRSGGCSRGFFRTESSGRFVLELAPDGLAKLTLTAERATLSGSFDHGGMRTAESKTLAWVGHATSRPGRIDVVLTPAAASEPSGAAPLSLSCVPSRVGAETNMDPTAEAGRVDARTTRRVAVLACKGAPSPLDSAPLVEAVPLSASRALSLVDRGGRGGTGRWLYLAP